MSVNGIDASGALKAAYRDTKVTKMALWRCTTHNGHFAHSTKHVIAEACGHPLTQLTEVREHIGNIRGIVIFEKAQVLLRRGGEGDTFPASGAIGHEEL